MKKFNAAEIVELNLSETKNGIFDDYFETFVLLNDDLAKKPKYPHHGGGCGKKDDEVEKKNS